MNRSMLAFVMYNFVVCMLLLDSCHALPAEMTRRGSSEFSHEKREVVKVNCGTFGGLSNGCSAPRSLTPDIYNDVVFTEACHRHDICYACSAYFSVTKEECDIQFRKNMLENCDHPRAENNCEGWANVYYKAVDWFGDDAYETSQREGQGSAMSDCQYLASNQHLCW